MEIIFLIISVLIVVIFIYIIGRMFHTNRELIRAYKTSEFLFIIHFFLGIVLTAVIFVTLCALNNTFWYLPYLTK